MKKGESFKGTFVSVSDDAISVERKRQNVAVPRNDVARVALRLPKGRKSTLIGLAIGAGAGAGIGVGAGEWLANESGGDFANLKPAIAVGFCAIGALVGAIIGSVVGNRGSEVYRAK